MILPTGAVARVAQRELDGDLALVARRSVQEIVRSSGEAREPPLVPLHRIHRGLGCQEIEQWMELSLWQTRARPVVAAAFVHP